MQQQIHKIVNFDELLLLKLFESLEPLTYKYYKYFSKVMNLNEIRLMNQTYFERY